MAVLPSPVVRVTVAVPDPWPWQGSGVVWSLGNDQDWDSLQSFPKIGIVSRPRTMHPQSPTVTIGGTVLNESYDLTILGVTFDSKMTFGKHLTLDSRAASQRLGILRKSWRVFHDRSLLERCFRSFVLPVWDYSSAVWCSAADTHLKLLDC